MQKIQLFLNIGPKSSPKHQLWALIEAKSCIESVDHYQASLKVSQTAGKTHKGGLLAIEIWNKLLKWAKLLKYSNMACVGGPISPP